MTPRPTYPARLYRGKGAVMRIWRIVVRLALAAAMGIGASDIAAAQDDDALMKARIEQIVAVMQGKGSPANTFHPRFLADVPAQTLRDLTAQLTAQGGALLGWRDFRRERQGGASFTLRFDRGSASARIELNPEPSRLVSGFRIFALTPDDDTFAKIEADFAALPGKAGFAVHRLGDGAPALVHSREADTPFAVGSAFKLYVLAALARQVHDGRRRWSDVIPVSGKSFPGGTVHTLPDGAPITLHTLASLMIAISDNTATDMLVRLVGQAALADEVKRSGHARPQALAPMLTTAQFFALKRAGARVAARYARATPTGRAKLLAALDTSGVAHADPGEVFGHGPVAIGEVEWFASPADLAAVMDGLRRLDSAEAFRILAINTAIDPIAGRAWAFAGYKGGSEDGVINMTWLLRDATGRWVTVTGSWNDPASAVDHGRFERLMARLIKQAGR